MGVFLYCRLERESFMRVKSMTTAKRVGAGLASTVLIAALTAATAGSAYGSIGSMTEFSAPTKATTIDKNLITIGSNWTGYGEILGLTSINGDGSQTLADISKGGGGFGNLPWGLIASDMNQNPSPYQYNSYYNLYAASTGKTMEGASTTSVSATGKPDVADSTLVAELGNVSKMISKRPDILMGCDANRHAVGGSIVLKSTGKAVSVAKSSLATNPAYSPQIETVHNMKTTSANNYQTGDESYDPYLVENASFYGDQIDTGEGKYTVDAYSLYTIIPSMYRLAVAAQGVTADNPAKHNRYSEDAMTIAQKYEAYAKGLQDYVLKKLNDGTITKKSVAVVVSGGIDTETNVASCYRSTKDGSVEAAATSDQGGSNLSRSMEMIENTTTNVAGTWDETADGATAKLQASELMKADVIILNNSSDKEKLVTLLEAAGYKDSSKYPKIFANGVSGNGAASAVRGWSPEVMQSVGVYMGYIYPEVINPVYALAYYYTEFYHVKTDTTTLSNAMGMYINDMDLPDGVTSSLDGYKKSTVQGWIDEGIAYYTTHQKTIDSTRSKLAMSTYYKLPSKQSITIKTSTLKIKRGKTATIKVKGAKTTASFKTAKAAKGKIKVSTKGKVSVAKKCKTGTYKVKVKVNASVSSKYLSGSKSKTIKVVVK